MNKQDWALYCNIFLLLFSEVGEGTFMLLRESVLSSSIPHTRIGAFLDY